MSVNPAREPDLTSVEHPALGVGEAMYGLCEELFPICRSLTGNGVRQTLSIIKKKHLPNLRLVEVPTGEKCFDWTVPKEWNIRDAYVIDPDGNKILDFAKTNLHVVGYSVPVNRMVSLEELERHLHSLPQQPDAIPYVTSYYEERWGFCITENQRKHLLPGNYHVVIDSTLTEGSLTYAEMILPGRCSQEVFLSTYVCHPSLANNELSGPAVVTFLAKWLASQERKYTYRLVFVPETIGSIAYLSKNLAQMKENVIAGFNVTCIGDDRAYSYVPSRQQNSLSDKVALHTLKHIDQNFRQYSYLEGGSDERQYCSPGVDLPVASVMRSKYWDYPEYHTSLDNLHVISPRGLAGGYTALKRCIECLEHNEKLRVTVACEPQLGQRGLYPTLSTKNSFVETRVMMNLLAFCDGRRTLLEIADIIHIPMWKLLPIVDRLKSESLLKVC